MLTKLPREVKTVARYRLRKLVGEIPAGERLRKIHMLRAYKSLPDLLAVRRVLDAGSGDGVYSFWLADRVPDVRIDAWDLDAERVRGCQMVQERFGYSGITFARADLNDLAAQDAYDLITCTDVLEHIEDDRGLVAKFLRALRPGGRLVIHVPTGAGPHPLIKNAPPDPYHVRDGYSRDALVGLLEQVGFRVERARLTCGWWGSLAHDIYTYTKLPVPLRLLSFPLTAALVALDTALPHADGQGVMAVAVKRSSA